MNIKGREGHFFSDMINIDDFDPSLLHVNKTAIDYDFIVYDVKYIKSSNRIHSLYLVFNNIDTIFRKSGRDKYLIFSSTEKNKVMLENYTEIFDDIPDKIELMIDDKVKYHKDIMRIKFKTNDDIVFNEMINILCV